MPLIEDENLPHITKLHIQSHREMPQELRVKNRRKRYLESHPEYFGPSLELADPLLYDRLVRHHQTASEREAEVRKKGYAGTLEADLFRSEAKLEAAQQDGHPTGSLSSSTTRYVCTSNGEITQLETNEDGTSLSKEEAYERWREVMEQRFLAGKDVDFDYETVDESEHYDDLRAEERDAEDDYFDDEVPENIPGELEGQTGIQDF